MKKEAILEYLKYSLSENVDYTYVVIDMRKSKPTIFRAWKVKKVK